MTLITPNDTHLKKVLGQKQPALLMFYNGSEKPDKPLHDALSREAKKREGELLVIAVDVNENPQSYARYGSPETPALVTLTAAFFGRKIKSTAERIRPADLRAHIEHLLNDAPLPQNQPEAEPKEAKGKKAVHVTQQTFRSTVLKSNTPVLVDFWAPWCGPCLSIAPFIDQMAQKYAGSVKVVKLNVDENQKLAGQFGVQSIPTFIVFDGGQPVNRSTGASPGSIENMIREALHGRE